MDAWIVVLLITYVSVVRPALTDDAMDPFNMWVWQVLTVLVAVVPPWIPMWHEVALASCFVLACLDASLVRHTVRDVVFPEVRRHLRSVPSTLAAEESHEVCTNPGDAGETEVN
mgnify:CR=1 FL=1